MNSDIQTSAAMATDTQTIYRVNPKMRKRTKTGCLSCRKRRIKCGEEQPTCRNCVQSRRQCEGYHQRVIFKSPQGVWPNHLSLASSLQFPTLKFPSYIPHPTEKPLVSAGADNDPSVWPVLLDLGDFSPEFRSVIEDSFDLRGLDTSRTDFPGPALSSWLTVDDIAAPGTNHPDVDQVEVVEYLDDDYFDVASDEDSAICMQDDRSVSSTEKYNQEFLHPSVRGFDHLGALDLYRPQHTASPLKDASVARFFAIFMQSVGPSLSFGQQRDRIFTYQIPVLALNDLALLHALLALTTLHVASLQSASRTPSYKHYAYSLKRLSRALAKERTRLRPSTFATCLFLAEYEFLCGEHSKWGCHLVGISQIMKELDFRHILGTRVSESNVKDEEIVSNPKRVEQFYKNKKHDCDSWSHCRDMIWYIAKQDTYHAILCGNFGTPLERWKEILPKASHGSQEGLLWYDMLSALMDIAQFSADERKKKQTVYAPTDKTQGMAGPYSYTKNGKQAEKHWSRLNNAIRHLKSHVHKDFNFRTRLPKLTCAPEKAWKDPKTASFLAMLQMGELLLLRSHPTVSHSFISSLVTTHLSTAALAESIGQMVTAIVPAFENEEKETTPDLRGALNDCVLPLYMAAAQYEDVGWRSWTIQTFNTIARLTGWHLAKTASVAVQHIWIRLAQLGSKHSWTSISDRTTESETHITCSSSWGLFDDDSWRGVPDQSSSNVHDLSSTTEEDAGDKPEAQEVPCDMESANSSYNVLERVEILEEPSSIQLRGVGESENPPMTSSQPSSLAVAHCNPVSPTDAYSDSICTDQSNFSSAVSGSSEEESEDSMLRSRQREMVDRVMKYFHAMLRVKSPSATSGSRNTTSDNRRFSSETATVPSSRGLGKRPKKDDDDEGFESDEDEAPSKRQKMDGASISSYDKKRKFACPYFKRNPEKYLDTRSCVGPGWEEVRRVKEHLYRNHKLPIFCARCYETFKSEVLLHAHQRKEEPCKTRPRETVDGVDKEQEKKLKSRKRSNPEMTEENKWKEMYRLLFPSDDEMTMPSAYLDEDWEKMYQKAKRDPSNELIRYEQFLRRELPPAVRRELEVAVEREFYPMEERLKSQLVDIVRDLQLQLFQSYTHRRNPALMTSPGEINIPSTGHADQITQQDCTGETLQKTPEPPVSAVPTELLATTIEEQLASYEPPPPLSESIEYDFDAVRFQLDEWSRDELFWDSTYGSEEVKSFWEGLPANGDYLHNREDFYFDNGEGPSEKRS